MKIGTRVRDLRIRRRLTLKEFAKKTGLTTSFLSQLERDLTSPSVGSLEKIAFALNTQVGYLFGREEGKELIFIKKRTTEKKVIKKEKNISCEALASGFLNIKMLPQICTIGAGRELTKDVICPEGEKFGFVLKGKIEMRYDSERLTLEEGDSIYCAHTQPLQKVKNIGNGEGKLLWIVLSQY